MNNALTKTCAAPAVKARSPLVRLARRGAAAVILAGIAVSAQAQYNGERGGVRSEAQRSERFESPRQADQGRGDARSFDSRAYEARDEQRRQMQMQQDQNMRNAERARGGRMTPDERRDLRRQINEAGIDLYQRPPRR
jgi:hypothetical protein